MGLNEERGFKGDGIFVFLFQRNFDVRKVILGYKEDDW